MRIRQFFLGVPIGLSLTAMFWFALLEIQMGVPTASSQWVADVVVKKHEVARMHPQNGRGRIFFIGGSNVLFGIDAKAVSEAFKVDSINFGLSAIMSPKNIFSEVKKSLLTGDIAVLAMEYSYYKTPQRIGDVELDYMMAHNVSGFREMKLQDRVEVMLSVSLVRLLGGLWSLLTAYDGSQNGLYQASSIDAYGNETSNNATMMPNAFKSLIKHLQAQRNKTQANDAYWQQCKDFVSWSRDHGVKVLITFPSFLYFDEYKSKTGRVFFNQSIRLYESLGVNVLGDPFMFMYDKTDMYDTRYHLNSIGRKKRTNTIIGLLHKEKLS